MMSSVNFTVDSDKNCH